MTQIEITPAELPFHEWIGLFVKVDSSCDPTINGLSGFVIDETRNTIRIETDISSRLKTDSKTDPDADLKSDPDADLKFDSDIALKFDVPVDFKAHLRLKSAEPSRFRAVTVPKAGAVFVFTIPERISQTGRQVSVKIDGNIMLSQPQNRIKNLKKSKI